MFGFYLVNKKSTRRDIAPLSKREALMLRGHQAALRELQRHADQLPAQAVANIETWLAEETDARVPNDLDAVTDEDGNTVSLVDRVVQRQKQMETANKIRMMALGAAQSDLLKARDEKGYDPAVVDEVLRDVDRMILAAKAEG